MDFNKLRLLAGINIQVPTTLSASDTNEIRKLAGLPPLPESIRLKEEPSEDTAEEPADPAPEDTDAAESSDNSKETLISKIASHLEGKTAAEISAMLHQIYDAGFADAKNEKEESTEDEEPTASEEPPVDAVKEGLTLIRNAQFKHKK